MGSPEQHAAAPEWQDVARSVPDRVEALLRAMSLEEKIAQLGSRWVHGDVGNAPDDSVSAEGDDAVHNVAPMQDVFSAGATTSLTDASRHGLGHLTRVYGSVP